MLTPDSDSFSTCRLVIANDKARHGRFIEMAGAQILFGLI